MRRTGDVVPQGHGPLHAHRVIGRVSGTDEEGDQGDDAHGHDEHPEHP